VNYIVSEIQMMKTQVEKGATYSIIVYDTQENLPQKTMFAREKGVLVAVVDIQSGTWKMAREIFEVLQKEITSKRKSVTEINTRIIQEVATDIGLLVKHTSDIRGKTAKIQTLTEKIDEDLDEIKDAVGNYQNKLKTAVIDLENGTGPITEQVESRAVNLRRYK
jgi:endonuclease III-like uncharacterized protein